MLYPLQRCFPLLLRLLVHWARRVVVHCPPIHYDPLPPVTLNHQTPQLVIPHPSLLPLRLPLYPIHPYKCNRPPANGSPPSRPLLRQPRPPYARVPVVQPLVTWKGDSVCYPYLDTPRYNGIQRQPTNLFANNRPV